MGPPKKNRVTLQEVAKHAGVSRSTASLIVRNSPTISEATRKKVLASMNELGYVYDRVAANLRSQRSTTIGIIITDIANTFYSDLFIGIHEELEKEGYTGLLGTTFDLHSKQDRLISTMLEHRVGGIILVPVSGNGQETAERLQKLDIPVVLTVRELPESDFDYVGVDYSEGTQLIINHLIDKGHRRIAFIGGRVESSTWTERMKGFRLAHEGKELHMDDSLVFPGAINKQAGIEAAEELLKQHQDHLPTAIFCFSDLVAFGVILGLRRAGIAIGKDIEVVGFDNVPESEIVQPPLTTVSSFARQIGTEAANLLQRRITNTGKKTEKIIIQPELIIRDEK
ncbi:LacI family DNA-binding transcriptional regulator [Sporosarcina sp. 179-K 3D1 HS]|uniref:LacI family DNA-binding transcriptional regulator n=1 Tax=Sporosarcina sp. 179-K 3D1 HS TaxID=3232169 RepID=UPI0039A0850A